MKTASQANNPQQSQAHQPVSQAVVPTPASSLDVDAVIQKLTSELSQMSITDILNSPVLAAALANPELVGMIKTAFINAGNKNVKQEVVATEVTLPKRYGVLVGMFNLH